MSDQVATNTSKQAHLNLLLRLQKKERTRAVIGNTSGTLDLAALIGLSTFSIHQFGKGVISYQECRLYIQMWFMTIGALIKNEGSNYELSSPIENWLEKPRAGDGPPQWQDRTVVTKQIREKKGNAGFSKMFSVTFFSPGKPDTNDLNDIETVLKFD